MAASALENFVNNVRTLSASGNIADLVRYLQKSRDLLTKNFSILDNVLETLDIQQHSVGVLFVLLAKYASSTVPVAENTNLLILTKTFIELLNVEQVKYAAQSFYDLCHNYTNEIKNSPTLCLKAIPTLVAAIEKMRTSPTQLTPIHADLCLISLKSKCFKIVLKFLDLDVTEIATTDDIHLDSKYFLLYYYYGGMIYTAFKNYDRALYFYEVAVSTPAMTMSYIMLESYKKFILVSLILHGRMLLLPKYPTQVISRFLKPLSQPYQELATAFGNSSCDEVRSVMNKHKDAFIREQTWGLVKKVAFSLYKKNIQRLTKTFLTLSLADVAHRVELPSTTEAESYILKMIKTGDIYATINKKDGMVVFKDNPEKYDSAERFLKIQEDMTNVMELNKRIKKMEEEIKVNPMFIKKSVTQEDDISSKTIAKNVVL